MAGIDEKLSQLDSAPLPIEDSDLLYVVRSGVSYKTTVGDLPSTGGGGVDTVGTINSQTKSANGAVISGNDIIMQTADTTHVGLVTRATTAEQKAGTDTAKYSTPETVAGAYNAYAPTVITSSSTLTTAVSMLIATGAGGYTTTLPDASTFPASQLGKPIYYVNNSSAANTIGVETGGFTNVTFSITGATTTPPLYALSSTTLPTVTSMTIAGNVATATANNASAQTFDYVTSNNILQVTPKMTFTNGNVLTIDPSSALGSTKFNYPVSNTVQVGSKVQVDVGGTVSEITVAAGSQTSNAVFDSSWGILKPIEVNGYLFYFGINNNKLANSIDGDSWTYLSTLPLSLRAMCYFNGKYYIGGVGTTTGTASIYSSSDLVNWTIAHTITLGRVISSWVATDGTNLVVAYSGSAGDTNAGNNTYYIYSSTDGTNYTQRVNQTTGTVGTAGEAENRSLFYANGKFIYANFANSIAYSNSGISWTNLNNPIYANGYVGGAWYSGSLFCISSFTGVINTGTISTSPDFSTWTNKVTGLTYPPDNFVQNGTTVIALADSPLTASYSVNSGITWSTGAAMVSRAVTGIYSTILSKYVAQLITANGHIQTTPSPTVAWTDVNMTTGNGYQFTMTSPSIAAPTWAALGGQTEQYSVSATSTPSFVAASTPVYTRSTNDITITYAAVTPSAYTHLQLKALTMNSGDILKQIGADLHIDVDFNITIPAGGKYALIPTSTAGWQSFQFAG